MYTTVLMITGVRHPLEKSVVNFVSQMAQNEELAGEFQRYLIVAHRGTVDNAYLSQGKATGVQNSEDYRAARRAMQNTGGKVITEALLNLIDKQVVKDFNAGIIDQKERLR